jgi:hypothetical protein
MSSNSDPIQNEKKEREKELNRLIMGTRTPAEEREEEREVSREQ